MMMFQNHFKTTFLLMLFLSTFLNREICTNSFSSENNRIILNDQVLVHVGIILDMNSWNSKSIHSFITMAISDFYELNNNYRTRIVIHTRDSGGKPLKALSAVLDLLNNIKVKAIIGPETYLEANLLAPVSDNFKVPIFSFAGSSFMDYPYLFHIKEDKSVLSKTITALVVSNKWNDIIFLYEDVDYGLETLSYLLESFKYKSIRVDHTSAVPTLASDDQIIHELQRMKISETSVVILHMSSLLAYRVLLIAKTLGMASENYAWIVVYDATDILQTENNEIIESMEGIIGLRSYIPSSSKFFKVMARWYNEFSFKEVSVHSVWAYDTIWVLAESIERLGTKFSFNTTQIDSMILNELSKTRFKGLSGDFRFINGKLASNGFKIVNVKGNVDSREFKITPKRRMLQTVTNKTLKVGVLARRKFGFFIDTHFNNQTNVTTATGFSVDVFNACIHGLPYEVTYDLIPYADGTYDDLIKKVYDQEIDAILGDSTILENRSQYVDFTATYTDLGVGTLSRINHNDMWIFLRPLDLDLWLSAICFAILTGITIFAIESMHQGSQRSPAQQIGATFWFILMTLFFTQREKLASNLAKFVAFVWLLVVLILISSYTATLASLLTVEQFEFASKGGIVGFHGGSFVSGVVVENYNFEDYRHRPYYSYEAYADALSKGGKHGGADAIVDEIPYIKMFLGRYSSSDYAMVSSEPITSGFAFIFQKGSPLVTEMSRQIAKIREDRTLERIEKQWFEKQSSSSQDLVPNPKTLNFGRFRGLFLISGISSAFALMISVILSIRAKLEIHSVISFVLQHNLVANLRHLLHRNIIRI